MIEIDPDHLEVLLELAKHGDVARSKRPVCSAPDGREPNCALCRAFTAAEVALNRDPA